MNKTKVNFIFYQYSTDQVITGQGSNAIIFINKGAANVEINGLTLATNQSLDLNSHISQEDFSQYTIRFTGAGVQLVNVILKFDN